MNVTFHETMAGALTLFDGGNAENTRARTPISFTVTATAPGPEAFLTGATMQLSGTVTVGGIVRDAALDGTLSVNVLRGGEMVYEVTFADSDGSRYRFLGRKAVRITNLLGTMTTLHGTLYRGTVAIGAGSMSFSLRDLPSFLASFRLAGASGRLASSTH